MYSTLLGLISLACVSASQPLTQGWSNSTTAITSSWATSVVSTQSTVTSPAFTLPANVTSVPPVTVYQPELIVTVIDMVTVVCDVYITPVTTIIKGAPYTIQPGPKKTVTETQGTVTVVVVQPTATAPATTVTTTVTVGTLVSTIYYVPTPGPISTQGLPGTTGVQPAPTYVYTAPNSVCVCPLPTTATQYVTVYASAQLPPAVTPSPATGALPVSTPIIIGPPTYVNSSSVPAVPSNCVAPNVAAAPTFFPGLIIPVQAKQPDQALGSQYTVNINADQEVVFQFEIPTNGRYSVNLALPSLNTLLTSSWSINGDGIFSIAKIPTAIDTTLTYNKLPQNLSFTDFTVVQGGILELNKHFEGVAGTPVTFVIKSKDGATATWFEDYNCPYVGLSIVAI